MLQVIYEGTPVSVPVQKLDNASPIYWEAGAIGMLDANGAGLVSDGTTNAFGLLADRRNTTVGIANASFLPSNPGGYGDESLYNQPGHGNNLYGNNSVIPLNTIPTTTLLRDETMANPNTDSRYVTMYVRGGVYATDQFATVGGTTNGAVVAAYAPGQALYVAQDGTGRLCNNKPAANALQVGVVTLPVDGNGFLQFKLEIL